MSAKLQLQSSELGFENTGCSSNPPHNYINWSRSFSQDVENPTSAPFTIDPSGTLNYFNATRATSISSSTEFVLTRTPLGAYRFTWDGTGTNPAFRTNRGLNLSTLSVVCTLNSNQTLTVSTTAGTFTAVLAGDVVFIPGVTTGDVAGAFNTLNEGLWNVLSVDGTGSVLQLGRAASTTFTGITQTVTPTLAYQFQAFSPTGVQVGDNVRISAGFSAPVTGTYTVTAVNPVWFEVTSTLPLPITATAVPGTSGMSFYSGAKRYVRIEADQLCSIRLNGDTGDFNQITPWAAGDASNVGEFVSTNTIWSLSIVNKSTSPLNVFIIAAE